MYPPPQALNRMSIVRPATPVRPAIELPSRHGRADRWTMKKVLRVLSHPFEQRTRTSSLLLLADLRQSNAPRLRGKSVPLLGDDSLSLKMEMYRLRLYSLGC